MTGQSDEAADDETDENAASAEQTTLLGIVVFLAIGGAFAYGGLHLQDAMPSDADVEPIEATVTNGDYTQRGSGSDRSFAIDVTYEYEVDGQTHASSNINAGATSYTVDTRQRAELLLEGQWAVGTTTEAMVKCLGVKPRGFLFLRRALQIPRRNPQGVQSPQAWIRPLPDLYCGDGKAFDRPCFWT